MHSTLHRPTGGFRGAGGDAFKMPGPMVAISINQSKFIFQVITEKLQCNNVVALERLPEKHYAH